jgi:hypothetical protein
MRALTTLHPKRLIYTQASPTQLTLSGYASTRALREVEEERENGNLWLVLADVKATTLHGTPAKFFQSVASNLAIEVHAGQWAAELEKVSGASYAEILIPVTSDPQLSVAAGRVRKARALIRGGEFNAAAAEMRQALDPVREFYRTLDVYSGASQKAPSSGRRASGSRCTCRACTAGSARTSTTTKSRSRAARWTGPQRTKHSEPLLDCSTVSRTTTRLPASKEPCSRHGAPPPAAGAAPAGHVRIGYAHASTDRQSLDTQTGSLNAVICYGRSGEISTNRRDEVEMTALCLRILQAALVYLNTLMLQDVLVGDAWSGLPAPADRRGLTPLF